MPAQTNIQQQTSSMRLIMKFEYFHNPLGREYPRLLGYPQRMRLHRRLFGICTICFLTFIISLNCKLTFYLKNR